MNSVEILELKSMILAIESTEIEMIHSFYNVPTMGNQQVNRPDGVLRWMHCQLNSVPNIKTRDIKSQEILKLVITEHGTNFACCRSSHR